MADCQESPISNMAFLYSRTIRLADTDAAGVVYFTRVLDICHEAYEAYLHEGKISLPHLLHNLEIALPIVHAEVNFLRPLMWGNQIEVEVRPQPIEENEFRIEYKIISNWKTDPKAKVIAQTRHLCINANSRKRVSLPPQLQAWFKSP